MVNRESTDATESDETETESSIDSFPEVSRDTNRTATEQAPDESETGTAGQSNKTTGEDEDQSHGCNHDNDVPCRFQ